MNTALAFPALAALAAFGLPRAALAQPAAVPPSQLTLRDLSLTSPAPPPPRVESRVSARVALGLALPAAGQSGAGFALRFTAGSRVFFPTYDSRAWVFGPDAGIDRTWGLGHLDATLLSLGASTGHLWGLTGVALAPRVLFGWRDSGDTVWGLRTGVRMLVVGGILDLEVAHQYVTGDHGDDHQVQLTTSIDLGLIGHTLATLGDRRPSP